MSRLWVWPAVVALLGVAIDHLTCPTYTVHTSGGIVITGASSGIGRHAALALDDLGFTVFGTVRKESDAVSLTKERSSIIPIVVDVTDDAGMTAAAANVSAELGKRGLPLVGLVNNAGISYRLPFELDSVARIENLYNVNVFGVARSTLAFTSQLRAGKGRIVNIGSVAGLIPTRGSSTYSGAKAALEMMTDVLRMELMPFGVSVSIVEPAYVKTKIASKQSPIKKVDQEKLKDYAEWVTATMKKRARDEVLASSVDVTNDAITDALTSPRPRTRYVVANVGGIPASFYVWLTWLLPDNIQHALTMR